VSRVHPKTRKGPRVDDADALRAQMPSSTDPDYLERMAEAAEMAADAPASYFAALAALRLRALLTGQRFAEPADEFDLILAAALMRARA
jgi:hypothetical protein